MKIVYGLGNPDKKYQNTRHNLGQTVIQKFVNKQNNKLKPETAFKAQICKIKDTLYVISTDYMNLSGFTLQSVANYYKIDPSNIYVIHDDLDVGVGEWKLQFDRGSAGHNGVASIIEHLHTQAFNRIRIGIGHPPQNILVEDYVLQPFSSDEKNVVSQVVEKIVSELDIIVN